MFLSTLYLQQNFGFTSMQVGLAFVPLAVTSAAGGLLAPRLLARFGHRRMTVVALALAASSFGLLAQALPHGIYATSFLPAFLISGFGFAAAFVPFAAQPMASADPRDHGIAFGVFQTSTSTTAFLTGGAILAAGAVVAARSIPSRRARTA